MPPKTPPRYFYRVYWLEEGKVMQSRARGETWAFQHMERLLAKGIVSWMVPIPYETDDIAF